MMNENSDHVSGAKNINGDYHVDDKSKGMSRGKIAESTLEDSEILNSVEYENSRTTKSTSGSKHKGTYDTEPSKTSSEKDIGQLVTPDKHASFDLVEHTHNTDVDETDSIDETINSEVNKTLTLEDSDNETENPVKIPRMTYMV